MMSPAESRRHLLIALLLAGAVALCYHFVDRPVAIWAHGLDSGTVAIFKKITILGGSGPYLVALAVSYPILRFYLRRTLAAKQALFVIASIVVSGLTVDLIKGIVARWRPVAFFAEPSQYGFDFFRIGYQYNSFPSGHSSTALALACALSLLYPRLGVLWLAVGALVASSRVFVGAHYPADVLAGGWFGVVITLALSRSAWFREALGSTAGLVRDQEIPTVGH